MAVVEQAPGRLRSQIETDLGLSAAELAEALGVTAPTLAEWQTGTARPESAAENRLAELAEIHCHLRATFMPEAIPVWLHAPNRYLRGVAPAEMIRRGCFERVEAALEVIDSGIFT